MTHTGEVSELLACPFCGDHTGISTREGDTYRWLLIGGNCGCCEIEIAKVDRTLPHDHPTNLASAYEAWNTRPAPAKPVADSAEVVERLRDAHRSSAGRGNVLVSFSLLDEAISLLTRGANDER